MDDERRSFPARTGAWLEVRAFVERRSESLGLPRGAALRLELIAEELFINSVEYGYRGQSGQSVTLGIVDAGAEVELVVEDQAAEFNPFAAVAVPADSANPDERPVGGLGRALVVGLSARCQYVRTDRGNRITVAVLKAVRAHHAG